MPLLSIISTCMGRLEHLQRTLPTWLAQPDAEVMVVDWSCPDGSGDWVAASLPEAAVVRVPGRRHFNLSAARNAGAAAARGAWLCFVDADVQLTAGFGDVIRPLLDPDAFLTAQGGPHELMGTAVVPAAAFRDVEGYDEALEGWGSEDWDLYTRLLWRGLERRRYSHEVLVPLPHGEAARVAHAELKDKGVNWLVNRAYLEAKWNFMKLQRRDLPLEERKSLYAHVRETLLAGLERGELPSLEFSLGWSRLITGVEVENRFVLNLRPGPAPPPGRQPAP